MGLGISPMLFVITMKWALKRIPLLNLSGHLSYKWYADDGSFYFNLGWLWTFYKTSGYGITQIIKQIMQGVNPILHYLNNLPELKETGLKFCLKKSSLVRISGIWLKNYKSLGLSLYTNESYLIQLVKQILKLPSIMELKGSTRGRGANPITKRKGTEPSHRKLNYGRSDSQSRLNLSRLLESYRPYFGLLMSRLYSNPSLSAGPKTFQYKNNSLLGQINPKKVNKILNPEDRLDLYNSSSKLNQLLMNLLHQESNLYLKGNSKLKSKLKEIIWINDYSDILKVEVTNVLKTKQTQKLNHFTKYSELIIPPEELKQLELEYKKTLLKNS